MSMHYFLRNTPVETLDGLVVVSTARNPLTSPGYETMVFPINPKTQELDPSHPLELNERGLTEHHEVKKNRALRVHRAICQRFDRDNRSFIFDVTTQNYIPNQTT